MLNNFKIYSFLLFACFYFNAKAQQERGNTTINPRFSYFIKTKDTNTRRPLFYVSYSMGVADPTVGGTFGGSGSQPEEDIYTGSANIGIGYNLTTGIRSESGFELTLIYSFYKFPFEASGFMTENAPNYSTKAVATGTYSYNNSCFLTGPSKYFYMRFPLSVGVHLLFGSYSYNLPATNGNVTMESYDPNTKQDIYTVYSYSISKDAEQAMAFDFGLRLGVNITKRIVIYGSVDWLISQMDINTTGYVYYPGNTYTYKIPTPSNTIYSRNINIGIEYGFGRTNPNWPAKKSQP